MRSRIESFGVYQSLWGLRREFVRRKIESLGVYQGLGGLR